MKHLEEQIAHLIRTVDELSEDVARQDGEISQLTRQVAMLAERERQRAAEAPGAVVLGDERPPHY